MRTGPVDLITAAQDTVNSMIAVHTPVVFERDGEVYANSRDVAEYFGKGHHHVLRNIDRLIDQHPNLDDGWFHRIDTAHPSFNKSIRSYDLTKDGFTLLVMRFTGDDALKFQMTYIQRFNEMEAALKATPNFMVPTNYVDAMQRATDEARQKETLLVLYKQQLQL